MTIQELGSLGELIAAIATIVTLAFLQMAVSGAPTWIEQGVRRA